MNLLNRDSNKIVSGTEENFRQAKASLVKGPALPKPQQTHVGIAKAQALGVRVGSNDVTRTAPAFNDPRYTSSTLSIPTDERTQNGLYRFFEETDPIVGASIKLLTELPLADVRLGTCEDDGVQAHFEEQWERVNMHKLLMDTTSETYSMGTCTPFGAFNEADYMWEQFTILNPDYVKIESTWVNQQPLIKLIPDETLKKIVRTRSPKFLYDQLPPEIIKYVLFNQEIPLEPNNVFLLTHAKRPYETKGKSIIKRILKTLMLEDRYNQAQFAIATRHVVPLTVVKMGDAQSGWLPDDTEMDDMRSMLAAWELDPSFCYDEETECLTDSGWKNYRDLSFKDRIGCFDPSNNSLKYDYPEYINIQDYDGDMMHFKRRNADSKVTPNHRMWARRDGKWQIILAEDIKHGDVLRHVIDPVDITDKGTRITIAGVEVDAGDFFELAGWYIAEGSTYLNKDYNTHYSITITQIKPEGREQIRKLLEKLPWKSNENGINFVINNKELANYFAESFRKGAENKEVPRWMLDAEPYCLERLLKGWLAGDGTTWKKRDGDSFYKGYSTSSKLIDNMQEVAFKLGYGSRKILRKRRELYKLPQEKLPRALRLDGTPFLDYYELSISKGQKLAYTSIWETLTNEPISKEPFENIPLTSWKQGIRTYVDWPKIDLTELLKLNGGHVNYVAAKLGVDVATVHNQVKMQNIDLKSLKDPSIRGGIKYTQVEKHACRVPYKGKVWCVTVPTGIIITRRKGHISILGQSLITHYGVNIEYYGSSGHILPLGPEFDRLYKLKFIGLGVHEMLITGQGGSYAQSYTNLEVQRQRFLNLQMKLENFVHQGIFKPVADLCGFYRIRKATTSSTKKGSSFGAKDEDLKRAQAQWITVRDIQDNLEYKEFIKAKYGEKAKQSEREQREYVYPKIDWGGMSMASNENLKNFVKWLADKRPYLVDDATLARLARLDRDVQEEAYIGDLERKKARQAKIMQKNLLPYVDKKQLGGAGGGFDVPGDVGDISMDSMPGPGLEGGGGEPAMPVGGNENAPGGFMGEAPGAPGGETPEAMSSKVLADDLIIFSENRALLNERRAIERAMNG